MCSYGFGSLIDAGEFKKDAGKKRKVVSKREFGNRWYVKALRGGLWGSIDKVGNPSRRF